MRVEPIIEMVIVVFLLPFLAIAQEVRIEPNTKTTIESGTTLDITTGNLVLKSEPPERHL